MDFEALEALANDAGETPEAVVLWTLLAAIKMHSIDSLAQLCALYAARMVRNGDTSSN